MLIFQADKFRICEQANKFSQAMTRAFQKLGLVAVFELDSGEINPKLALARKSRASILTTKLKSLE